MSLELSRVRPRPRRTRARSALQQRHNVLPHPRPADLGLDPFLRLDIGECENEDPWVSSTSTRRASSPPASTTARTASCADSITDTEIGSANVK